MCLGHNGVVLSLSRFECRIFSRHISIFHNEPEAGGNLRPVEELAGEGDHAVHEVGLDESAADVALPSKAMQFGLRL